LKLYISPHPSGYNEDGQGSGGIWRVINAQVRHLPDSGIEIIEDKELADVVNIHAGSLIDTDKPIVQSCHGYYWTGDMEWPPKCWEANRSVVEVSRRASEIITPSEWIAYPIKRDMRKVPVVIPHGIEIEEFKPLPHSNYILWGKPRIDIVSDPLPMNELASICPEFSFVSTFGSDSDNVNIIGPQPYEDFKQIIAHAQVWLATARETGDIASREAMALGVPVLGWNWGGTSELVIHGETGYLAKPGDYEDLRNGLHYCIQYRDRLGSAAREYVKANCQWKDIIPKYAEVFKKAYDDDQYPVKVSVIIPTYNYAHFLPECLSSVLKQTMYDFEIIVVDDGSTDETPKVLELYSEFNNIKVIRQHNQKLPDALNTGHEAATGRYILNLDPDNVLPPNTLEILSDALDAKPWVDVAGGGLAYYSPDGNHKYAGEWPWGTVDVWKQLDHYNQLHSSAMMRARSIKRLGGYRPRQHKNEDAELWCRAMSAGLRFEQVTDDATLIYRFHPDNKSKTEGGEDDPEGPLSWNFYYPWRVHRNLMPFSSTARTDGGSWPVRSYDRPHIAIVIPCGPGHDRYLPDALDSLAGQTYQNFECIIGNDTGHEIDVAAMGHPWAKVADTGGGRGPAVARNMAIDAATAPLIFPLDADDLLYPATLKTWYFAWLEDTGNLVYGDCFTEDSPGHRKRYFSGPWSWEKIEKEAIYQVSILYAKQWWEAVGGYDENMLWEDWIFGLKMHFMGIGATYINEPWGVYRHWTGRKSDDDAADYGDKEKFRVKLEEVYAIIAAKEEQMACKGCRRSARGRNATGQKMAAQEVVSGPDKMVVYIGRRTGDFSLNSKAVRGRKYRIRNGVPFTVPIRDAVWIGSMADFKIVEAHELVEMLPTEQPVPPTVGMIADVALELERVPKPTGPTLEPIPVPKPVPESKPTPSTPLNAKNFSGISARMVLAMKAMGITSVEKLKYELETNGDNRLIMIKGLKGAKIAKLKEALGVA
jgi:glycosyltransferase involved in cell wall biosynthesis